MPLSDHEQKMLEQMEQALAAEDPKFASSMKGGGSLQRRRWVIGALGLVAGLGLVLVGVNTTMWVGAIGFALMVASVAYAVTPPRKGHLGVVSPEGGVQPAKGRARRKSSLIDRLDERWERRQGGNW